MKKFISILVVVIMAGALLAGCGSNETDSNGREYAGDFDPETNQVAVLNEVEFQVPDTWIKSSTSSGGVGFTSDEGILTADYTEDTFDISDESNQDAFIDLYASTDESFTETGRELITILDDTPALYFTSTRNISDYDMDCYELVFSTDTSFYLFIYGVRQDATYNHSKEFDDIIASITWASGNGEENAEAAGEVENEEAAFPENDFFSDEGRRAQYDELYKSYQISALYDYINSYISENGDSISPDDSVYEILGLVEPLVGYEGTWTVTQDEFDGSYSVTFDGANTISDSESVDPVVKGSNVNVTVGFQKNGWLFFDKFALSIDGEQVEDHSVKSYDRNEDIISGDAIKESYNANMLFQKVSDQLKDAGTAILRFENTDNNETFDHTLTDAEKNALYVGYLLRDNYTELSNLIFEFRNDYGIEE